MTQNNQFKFILNLSHIIKFLVPTQASITEARFTKTRFAKHQIQIKF